MPKIEGQIAAVTESGDLVTDISVSELSSTPRDDQVKIRCNGHVTNRIFPVQHMQDEMTFIALEGASGYLELSLVGDDASKFLGIKPGAPVSLAW